MKDGKCNESRNLPLPHQSLDEAKMMIRTTVLKLPASYSFICKESDKSLSVGKRNITHWINLYFVGFFGQLL